MLDIDPRQGETFLRKDIKGGVDMARSLHGKKGGKRFARPQPAAPMPRGGSTSR